MRNQLMALLQEYRSLQQELGVSVPPKHLLTPVRLKSGLGWYLLSECVDEERLMIRLSGTKIDDLFAKNITGLDIFDVMPKEIVPQTKKYFCGIIDQKVGGYSDRVIYDHNLTPYHMHSIALPLADDAGEVRFIISAVLLGRRDQAAHKIQPNKVDMKYHYFNCGGTIPDELDFPLIDIDQKLSALASGDVQWNDERGFNIAG